jgi:antitoxin CptB
MTNQQATICVELKTPFDVRRKRLVLRAKQRSTREVNLILSSFITTVLPSLGEEDILNAEHLLDAEDSELYRWVLDPTFAPNTYQILLQAIQKALPFPLSR